jgi:hypothetical protein
MVVVNCPIYNDKEYILTSDLLTKLMEYIPINNFQILFHNMRTRVFQLIGKYPDKILLDKIYLNDSIINPKNKDKITIELKFRQIVNNDNALRMDYSLYDENKDEDISDDNYQELGIKTRRAKERRIGSVIKKVYMWRKLYAGFQDDKGRNVKLTLEDAAKTVGISKKSLDDYLTQLRNGKNLGFNFNKHQNDKIGVLRSFIKKNKK